VNNHSYGYAQPHYTHSKWQQSQSQYPHRGGHGTQYGVGHFGYPTPTPPTQSHAITRVTVVVDTNVLLDYLMVIQKFVGDIERTKWPCVVVIPSVVISELDWCVCPTPALSSSDSEQKNSGCCRQKNTRKNISWSARAASRWILDKLKEDKEPKVLRVQASSETLEGSGSKDLVGLCILSFAGRRDSSQPLPHV